MENNCGNPYTNQIFQEAVERSDFAIVKTLLKYGVYLRRNQRNRNRLTALQQSVLDGNGRMAILLLEGGADIEAKTSNGWTCLHIAAALGDLDILTTLVNHCACLLAITKNEELPIDLAATREIKIKLAKEMSRVGYSELAQWYMKKLAAREGVFYVLSANTLLDLACDDNYDKSYSNGPPCYVRQEEDQNEVFMHDQTKRNNYWQLQDPQAAQFSADGQGDLWMEQPPNENPTYLSYSSGYISEVVFDSNSGEYSKVRRSASVSMSSGSSPRIKYPEMVVSESKSSISTVITPEEEDKVDNIRYGSLVRSGNSRRHSHAKTFERSNTIELVIDYSHFEDCDDVEEDGEEMTTLETNVLNINPPPAIIDENEENMTLSNQDDNHSSNEVIQNTHCEPTKTTDKQYKAELCDSYHGTSVTTSISTSKISDNQYESDIYDNYQGTPLGTSLPSSKSNDNQYKSDICDSYHPTPINNSISSTRNIDTQYKSEYCDSYHGTPLSSLFSSSFDSQEIPNELNPRYPRFDTPDVGNYEIKTRNVRFDSSDAANEFCNCPNCKKLGYAFSPDIRSSGRRVMHFDGEQIVLSPNQVMMSELQLQKTIEMMQGRNYPNPRLYHDETGERSLCYTQSHPHKPRKRKKKLFSGIRSIFKDSIKVQRGGIENSPVVDDAGILFAFSLRDRSKSKEIKNRYDVRRSNSFSGCTSPYIPKMVNTYTHDQVVPPPSKFSDTYGDTDPRKKGFYLENVSHGNNSSDASVISDDAHFKQYYNESTDAPSQMSDFCDESSHSSLGHHVSSYNSPLYESQSVIEEHSCEFHTCDCESQSISRDTKINNMMSQINVNDKETEICEESKFPPTDGKKCKTKEPYSGESL